MIYDENNISLGECLCNYIFEYFHAYKDSQAAAGIQRIMLTSCLLLT